jgi:hypothetical protein
VVVVVAELVTLQPVMVVQAVVEHPVAGSVPVPVESQFSFVEYKAVIAVSSTDL